MTDPRASLRDAKRVVLKVGSKSIAGDGGRFASIAGQIASARLGSSAALAASRRGGGEERAVVLVSSGAIALGWARLGLRERPRELALLQASAAAGQSLLMRAYEEAFATHGLHVAQLLLTHADLAQRDRYLNARAALDALLGLGAVPIINENDTVSVEEIKFGDNDQLAAMVATLVSADLLVLLTDVDGLIDDTGARVPLVADVAAIERHVRPTTSDAGTGGMASKVASARAATHLGVPVVVADARDPQVLARIIRGDDVGTLFLPQGAAIASRKHWIAYTLRTRGAVVVDDGAARALAKGGKSLLPAGVVGVRGDFEAGDAISIVGPDGRELARGLVRHPTRDVAKIAGARTTEIATRLGREGPDEIVHADDLVVL